jgi:CelD/BcsL family acetyltransferase involved in cellulose biosynthesis
LLQLPAWSARTRDEIVDREMICNLIPAWEDLCRRAVEDNVYFSPRYARALLNSVERNSSVCFALAWDGTRLIGLLPFVKSKFSIPIIGSLGHAWQSKYTFGCMPLLDKDHPVDAAKRLLEVIATVGEEEWIIPAVNIGGRACEALTAALRSRGQPNLFMNKFQRASLDANLDYDQHMRTGIAGKRRRELSRMRRRLSQLGKVTHEHHDSGPALDNAIAAFLKIEASGWKGRRGTALACSEDMKQFALEAFTGLQTPSVCRADMLRLDDQPVAVGITVFAGRTGFTVKCAYDESYRSYAVGLQLELEVMRSFLSERWADRLDGATSDAHVIDTLWPGRMEVADMIFSLSARSSEWRIAAIQRVGDLKSSSKHAAKTVLERLRLR